MFMHYSPLTQGDSKGNTDRQVFLLVLWASVYYN